MKAPEGMGMVVETADIQNYSREKKSSVTLWCVCVCVYTLCMCVPVQYVWYTQYAQ